MLARAIIVVLLSFVLPAAAYTAQPVPTAREMTLTLPHALRAGETVWLLVEVGAIGREQIELTTRAGRPLGTISPFGIRSGQVAGTYSVPIPVDALKDGRLALNLSLTQGGSALRAPTTKEVKSVRITVQQGQRNPSPR